MLKGTNSEFGKVFNLRIVLETIRLHGPVSRAETARITSLTRTTVSSIVLQLIERGLVIETGRSSGKRGMPSTLLELNPEGAFAVGLDMDRDHLTAVLMDFAGSVRQRIHHDLDFPTPDEGLDLLVDVTRSLIAQEAIVDDQILGVGVGFPGPLSSHAHDAASPVVVPLFFPGWQDVPIVRILTERLALPVLLENNASAAAVGEYWYGDHAFRHFYYVYLGVGLGGGAILNGQPYEGFRGNAGELGYLAVQLPERTTHLGEFFHLPTLYTKLREAGGRAATPHDLEALYRQRHEVLLAWLESAALHLAPALIAIEHLFDPEAIIAGGRLPEPLLQHLLSALASRLPTLRQEGKPYAAALLPARAGDDAAALGLATLPIYRSVAPNSVHQFEARPHAPRRSPVSWLAGRW